ncbi:hypothetical protein BGZ63DRAFT_468177 [Mariannaea sp. PMI_226]|nr:hypothetical protein BGZ63DRAFT_468177 [Mariannaea sp. PMI_226]
MPTEGPFSPNSSNFPTEGPPSPHEVDYDIWLQGGTTTTFDAMLPHANSEKTESHNHKWITTLNRENVRLQNEGYYYRVLVEDILPHLLALIWLNSCRLHQLIDGDKYGLRRPETTSGLSSQGRGVNPNHSALDAILTEKYSPCPSNAHSFMQTSNINEIYGLFDNKRPPNLKPYHFEGDNYIAARQLAVEITRENGKLRRRVAQDRSIVSKVLMHLVPQLRFHSNGLHSVVQKFYLEINIVTSQRKRNTSGISRSNGFDTHPLILKQNSFDNQMPMEIDPYYHYSSLNEPSFGEKETVTLASTVQTSIADLKQRIEELRLQYYYYNHLINSSIGEIFPLIRFHAVKLRFLTRKSDEDMENIQNLYKDE